MKIHRETFTDLESWEKKLSKYGLKSIGISTPFGPAYYAGGLGELSSVRSPGDYPAGSFSFEGNGWIDTVASESLVSSSDK